MPCQTMVVVVVMGLATQKMPAILSTDPQRTTMKGRGRGYHVCCKSVQKGATVG